jgi:CBS domain-containing protein
MNPNNPVSSIMTTHMVTVHLKDTARKVREVFKNHSFHHIPVVDEGDKLVGIISKEDFFRIAYLLSLDSTGRTYTHKVYEHLTAEQFMTKYPVQLDPDDSIGLAADIFMANKFHALPIVEDGRLVGLITSHDLLQYSFSSPVAQEEELEFDDNID